MSEFIKQLIDNDESVNKQLKLIYKFLSNKDFCSVYAGEGGFGKVHINKIPKDISIKLSNNKKIKLKNIAVKGTFISSKPDKKGSSISVINLTSGKKYKLYYDDQPPEDMELKLKKENKYKIILNFYDDAMGEGFSSMLISKLFENGVSPHFPLCFGSSKCDNQVFTLYENFLYKVRAEKTYLDRSYVSDFDDYSIFLKDKGIDIDKGLVDYFVISILHSLMVIQENYKTLHLDLFLRNIFIKDCSTNDKYFRGINMNKIDYFAYTIPGSKKPPIFLPFNKYKFLLKIGDYGLSVMNHKNITIINNSRGTVNRKFILKNNYPKYPKDYDKHFPDYFIILRGLLREFGGTSDLLIDLIRAIPILNRGIYFGYMLLEKIDKSKLVNIRDILNMDIFDIYRKYPGKDKKILKINYLL